MMQFSC